jgi:hypothetical protein
MIGQHRGAGEPTKPTAGTFPGSSLFPLTLVYVHIGDMDRPMWIDDEESSMD